MDATGTRKETGGNEGVAAYISHVSSNVTVISKPSLKLLVLHDLRGFAMEVDLMLLMLLHLVENLELLL